MILMVLFSYFFASDYYSLEINLDSLPAIDCFW